MTGETNGIRIGHRMSARPTDEEIALFQQLGIEEATIWTAIEDANYDYMAQTKRLLETNGIRLLNIGILDLHCDPTLVLGLPGRDKKIEQYKAYLTDLGRAGIRYTTYAHMANIKMRPYYQTGVGKTRGGTPTREFDMEVARTLPRSHDREYTEEEIWGTFTDFIREAMPVAEKAGVRIGLHPDDPPVPSLGGVARVFRNARSYERAIEIADSENFGLCLCVGTWAEGGEAMGRSVTEMIEHFGAQRRIFKVHFRNVDAPLPKFQETFVDNGYVDMYTVLRTLRKVEYDGVLLPDHVPGDRLHVAYTVGYMRAMRERVNAEYGQAREEKR
jgi:mannonate dehydratase